MAAALVLVHLCCGLHSVFNHQGQCEPAPQNISKAFGAILPSDHQKLFTYTTDGFGPCPNGSDVMQFEEGFWVDTAGVLHGPHDAYRANPGEYCIEEHVSEPNASFSGVVGLKCVEFAEPPPTGASPIMVRRYVILIGAPISATCLLISALIYYILPDFKRLTGRIFFCYMITFAFMYFIIALRTYSRMNAMSNTCFVCGLLLYYSSVSLFLWLNVMCWEVFNKTRSRRLASEESASKIIQFGLYAWGIPLLLLALVLVLEYSLPRNHPINPGFGAHMCWFQTSGYGSWIYYNALTIGLLAGNFILFTMTITTLVKHERESRNVTSTREKTKCWIYFRLWLIMGLSWLLEYLSLFLDNDSWLTLIADIFNVLQGVFLCYIFMINKSKLKEIRRSLKRVSQSSIITQVTSRSKNSSFSVSKKSSSSAGGALNRGFEHQNSQSSQGKKTASSSVKTKPSVGTSESSAQARANSCPEVEIATGNEKKVVMQDESEQNDTAV